MLLWLSWITVFLLAFGLGWTAARASETIDAIVRDVLSRREHRRTCRRVFTLGKPARESEALTKTIDP